MRIDTHTHTQTRRAMREGARAREREGQMERERESARDAHTEHTENSVYSNSIHRMKYEEKSVAKQTTRSHVSNS